MRILIVILFISLILMYLFSVTDQSPPGPRTHGRGQLRTSQSDKKAHQSPLLKRRGSIRRKHKSPTSSSDTTRKPVNRFRPPDKRKN
ncbi:unnamed protein product [Adineta ricciae]|uniref:Uncharacterized protein n=1 Tax=Adineta ricciae TaxID=249248 RepID=A0A816DQV4_ADIRI|nr:unnamed protein product [Adineta ricciae]